jgi:hypothetical protein
MATPYGQDQQDEAFAFEQDAERQAGAGPREQVRRATTEITAAYILAAGSTTKAIPDTALTGFRAAVVRALSRIRWSIQPLLHHVALSGHRLGVDQAERITGSVRVEAALSRPLREAIAQVDAKAAADLADAVRVARVLPVDTYPRALTAAAKATSAVHRVEATTRWVANKAITEGTTAVAEAAGVGRLWIAEPGACLTCLAYAGEIAGPGENFPAGLTFGDYSTVSEPLDGPPAHPNCRCRTEPWLGTSPDFGVSLPNTLRREALRQVALGRSDYASDPAKVRAADRLINSPIALPDIVLTRAKNAVARGGFRGTGRTKKRPATGQR